LSSPATERPQNELDQRGSEGSKECLQRMMKVAYLLQSLNQILELQRNVRNFEECRFTQKLLKIVLGL
jgi:hypothetical protein